MKSKFAVSITSKKDLQPTVDEIHKALRDLMWQKANDSGISTGTFRIEVVTDFREEKK